MEKILVVLMSLTALATTGFAEIIHLKDGRIVDEEIVERGRYYITTRDKRKILNKYFDGQVDFIEGEGQPVRSDFSDVDMSQYGGISEDKVKLILIMIDASGVRHNMERNIEQVLSQTTEDKKKIFMELFKVGEIIERLVPIYDKYFSEQELIEIIQFYESPTGQKFMQKVPDIMKDAVQVAAQYLQEKMSAP